MSKIISPPQKKSIIIIVGPTGVGKSALAIRLAKKFGGEIVNADPWQMYCGLDIATAKPRFKKEGSRHIKFANGIPHHLFDIAAPNRVITVKEWKKKAIAAIHDIHTRRKIPFIVGGTWFYIRVLKENLLIPEVTPNAALRKKLENYIKKHGAKKLFAYIIKRDPAAMKFLDPYNPRRLIRAWEVMKATKIPFSRLRLRGPKPPWRIMLLGFDVPDKILKTRIEHRVAKQIRDGLEKEVRHLTQRSGWEHPIFSAICIREWREFFNKNMTREDTIASITLHNLQLARKQRRLFLSMRGIKWVRDQKEAGSIARDFLKK